MRHSLELHLKGLAAAEGLQTKELGHNITKLYSLSLFKDDRFLEKFACLQCDSEGDCWRYPLNNNAKLPFGLGGTIEAFDACAYYLEFWGKDVSPMDRGDRELQDELTFHPKESNNTLGLMGTQYDSAIASLLRGIKERVVSINDIYLPLLFLLRHNLELKLKAAIIALEDITAKQKSDRKYYTHSVKELYKIFSKQINPAIEKMADSELKSQSCSLSAITKIYKEIVQSLDNHSFVFRFPVDKNGDSYKFVPKTDCISEVLRLYRDSDSFLCFAVSVLSMEGVLAIGDDKQREYYE